MSDGQGEDFSADGFEKRVRHRFRRRADIMAALSGDDMLNPQYSEALKARELRQAAVLIPIIDRGPEATVLLTQRTEHLPSHKGQIAFPGGKIEEGETPIEAALREAHEEVGLDPADVRVLGAFGDYRSGSGFSVVPVVGIVKSEMSLSINHEEVSDIFEVPLGFLMNQDSHAIESMTLSGRERFFYAMPWQDDSVEPPLERRIWGLTAGIIRTVQERLYEGRHAD